MILALRILSNRRTLIPTVEGPLTWSLALSGGPSKGEPRKSETQVPLPTRSTGATCFDNPTAGGSFFPVSPVTPPALDSRARDLFPFTGSQFAHAVAALWVFPPLAATPRRRRSRPHVSRFPDCRSEPVLILPFRPPLLAGTAGWRHLLRPGGRAPLCFRFAALRFPVPPKKVWPSFALAAKRNLFFGSPRKSGAWPGEQAPPALWCPAR
jgi:hypothetical protein